MNIAPSILTVWLYPIIIATFAHGFRWIGSTGADRVWLRSPGMSITQYPSGWKASRDFAIGSEKRHKEAIFGKKFKTLGTSSQIRHYRIVGRGGGLPRVGKKTGIRTKAIELPARRCMLLGKMDNTKARQISHSGKRSHRTQKVNLQWKRIWCISRGHYLRLRLSMKGLKTIKRLGLEEAARRFHLNLNNPKLFAGYATLRPKKEWKPIEFTECADDEEIDITSIRKPGKTDSRAGTAS